MAARYDAWVGAEVPPDTKPPSRLVPRPYRRGLAAEWSRAASHLLGAIVGGGLGLVAGRAVRDFAASLSTEFDGAGAWKVCVTSSGPVFLALAIPVARRLWTSKRWYGAAVGLLLGAAVVCAVAVYDGLRG